MWEVKKPSYGDHIKVTRTLYSHHGIYLDDSHVIHFASNDPHHELDPDYAVVCFTTLPDFLRGGTCLVRTYTAEQSAIKRPPNEVVNYAITKLGTKGYNLVTYNCEHFANECIFGEASSAQVDSVLNFLKRFTDPKE